MRKYNIPPAFSGSLQLGRQGENGVTQITFLCAGYAKMYGDGFAEAVHRTPDGTTYPVNIEQDENNRVSWLISDGDTATAGTGQLELRWMVNGNLAKSKIFSTIIKSALTAPETPPDAAKSWVDKVLKAAEDIKGGVSEQKAREIAQSVVDAYQETDPTVPEWAKAETKPTYTAAEVGAVPESAKSDIDKNTSARHTHSNKSALDNITAEDIAKWNSGTAGTVELAGATGLAAGSVPTVTETADSTVQARKYTLGIPAGEKGADGAKGEKGTDGADGKSAYQFAQDAGYTGTESDFSKKLNQTTFANPFALTFTGAASATYDGSQAVTVDLPSGGSSQEIETIKQSVAAIKEDLNDIENDTFTVSQGYIPIKLITDKFLSSSGIVDYIGWSATDNIKVDGLQYIYTEWSKASSYNKFLDSGFGLIKMVTIRDGLQKTNIPQNACYIALSNETAVMKGLKVWSPTKANSYENTLEIAMLKQDIPLYYEKHLTDKITKIREKETFSGVDGDEFIFITDYHMEKNANNSSSLIDKIIKNTGAKKIVFGGDAYDASSIPDLALNKIADFYAMFYENADKILSCVGNHEYNNPASNMPKRQIPDGQVYASVVNRNDLIHHSRYACNYTILNHSNKTMYLFVGCEYNSNITNESIKYILKTIKNNNGYNIIVFSHVGLDNGGDDGNVANIIDGFKRITDGIDKFNQKSSYIFDGITYDYSGCAGDVICVFSGHNHVDGCIQTDGGLNVISTTCDAYGAPEGGVVRQKGTITEQAFDVVNIDYKNKKIYMTRVGAGEDRVFSY